MNQHFQPPPPFTIQGPPPIRLTHLVPTMARLAFALSQIHGDLYR